MPLHQIYIHLTGATRLRRSWLGRLVVQVETVDGDWRDATARELIQIGFEASSARARRMRMLTPRERFTANGFPRDYIIDHGIDENGYRVPFTLEQQGYMCGNAVCPPVAAALVRANYRPRQVNAPHRRRNPDEMPLFLEAAE